MLLSTQAAATQEGSKVGSGRGSSGQVGAARGRQWPAILFFVVLWWVNHTAGRDAWGDEIGGCGSGGSGWSRPADGDFISFTGTLCCFEAHAASVTPS